MTFIVFFFFEHVIVTVFGDALALGVALALGDVIGVGVPVGIGDASTEAFVLKGSRSCSSEGRIISLIFGGSVCAATHLSYSKTAFCAKAILSAPQIIPKSTWYCVFLYRNPISVHPSAIGVGAGVGAGVPVPRICSVTQAIWFARISVNIATSEPH